MATIKSFTDLSQSKTLSKILPLESADMYYWCADHYPKEDWIIEVGTPDDNYECICAWSLAALLEQLPYEVCDDGGISLYLEINKEDDAYQLVYTEPYGGFESIETDRYEHFVDACVDMILNLNELNLL